MFRGNMWLTVALSVVLVPALMAAKGAGKGAKTPAAPTPVPTPHPSNTPTPTPQNLNGVVKSLDAKAQSLVLTVGEGDKAKDVTLTVNDKTVINLDDKAAKFTDLKENMKGVALADANNAALKVFAKNQTLNGVIKSLDAKAPAVVLTLGEGDKAKDVTVGLNEKTAVKIDGKDAKLEDLKEGLKAAVRTDGSSVLAKTASDAKP